MQGGQGGGMQGFQGGLRAPGSPQGGSPFQPGQMAQNFLRPGQSPLQGGGMQGGMQGGMMQHQPPQSGMMYGGGSPTRPIMGSTLGANPSQEQIMQLLNGAQGR